MVLRHTKAYPSSCRAVLRGSKKLLRNCELTAGSRHVYRDFGERSMHPSRNAFLRVFGVPSMTPMGWTPGRPSQPLRLNSKQADLASPKLSDSTNMDSGANHSEADCLKSVFHIGGAAAQTKRDLDFRPAVILLPDKDLLMSFGRSSQELKDCRSHLLPDLGM
jgi:hypothetical protein